MSGIVDWLKQVLMISSSPKAAPVQRASSSRGEARGKPVRQVRGGNSAQRIETVNMRSYNDATVIADILRENTTAIINVTQLSSTERARLIDFMAGLKAGLQANSSRVSEDVYLLAPYAMSIDADEDEPTEDDDDRLIIRPN
jgi:FtsZ-interacting cell division protein YlmF